MNNLSDNKKTWTLYSAMLMVFKPTIFWDWFDFGLMFRIYKHTKIAEYHLAIDIQIGWFNLWLQCWKKN